MSKDGKSEITFMRGARSFMQGRFETVAREVFDDGWTPEEKDERPLETQVTIERARTILSHNDSPDVGFDTSINPYRGCEHGCIYCYARPSHAYLELSPGLDFETKLFAKTNAAELLRAELGKPGYRPSPIALGANTDCYQPIERKYKITRQILEVLAQCNHPVTMVTKSALVERDLDLLAPMAEKNLVRVFVSIGSLDRELARKLEPRAASPQRRLDILRALSGAKVPCGVMVAALIPALNDKTMEHVLEAAAAAGAEEAAYVIIWLSLTPKPVEVALEHGDKLGHFAAYGAAMFWFCLLYPRWWTRVAYALGFSAMGVALEFAQRATGYRTFDVLDMAADAIGVLLGWALAQALAWRL